MRFSLCSSGMNSFPRPGLIETILASIEYNCVVEMVLSVYDVLSGLLFSYLDEYFSCFFPCSLGAHARQVSLQNRDRPAIWLGL